MDKLARLVVLKRKGDRIVAVGDFFQAGSGFGFGLALIGIVTPGVPISVVACLIAVIALIGNMICVFLIRRIVKEIKAL